MILKPKIIANSLFCAVTAYMLCSCSWMSEADTPLVAMPSKFNSAVNSGEKIESLPYLAWWKQFNDDKLNGLIESGLNNNLDINIALSNLEQARGQLTQVQLSWIPFVNLFGGYSSNPAFGDIGNFYGAWPQYVINIANVIQSQKQASYNVKAREAMSDGVRLTIIGQISAAYFSLIAEQHQLTLLKQLNNDLQQVVDFERAERKIGLRDTIEVEGVVSQQKLVQAQMEIVQHNIVLSNNSICYLLNQNPSNVMVNNNFESLDFSKFKPGSLPATVLQNRPDIRISEYELQVAHTGVGVSYSNLFPVLQLDEFFGYGSGRGSRGAPNNYSPLQDTYVNWGINPTTFGQIEAAKGAYQATVYKYIQTVRKALRDADNGFSANNRYGNNYTKIMEALSNLQSQYKLQQGLNQIGMMAYPKLLQNKLNVDNLELTANQAKLQHALALVNLYQELAGGYKYNNSESTTTTK